MKIKSNENQLLQINKNIPNAVNKALRIGGYNSGKMLVEELRKDMRLPKSGKIYKVYGRRKKLHQASSEKETPAYLSGKFSRGVNFVVRGIDRIEFGSDDVEYADYLEHGTKNMKARKPFGRTSKKFEKKIDSIITNSLNAELRKIGLNINKI